MASKRTGLTLPEQERKGRQAILRSANEVAAEEEALATGQEPVGVAHRSKYPKVTYRICPEAYEAIHDTKRALRQSYGIRATLEEVAEAALIAIYADLEENQESSILVSQYSGKPEHQSSG
jgi:hypothetical protein